MSHTFSAVAKSGPVASGIIGHAIATLERIPYWFIALGARIFRRRCSGNRARRRLRAGISSLARSCCSRTNISFR